MGFFLLVHKFLVHEGLRKRIQVDVASWEQVVGSIQRQLRDSFGDNAVGLAVVTKDGNGAVQESAQIFEDLITHR